MKNISQIETGTTPSKNDNENYSTDGIPWIKPDNLKGFKKLYDSKEKISQKGIQFSRIIPQGSILVCCIGTLGKMGIAGCDLTTNQQINSVTFKDNLILNEFGKYLIFASQQEYWKNATKSVVTMLNKSVQGNIKYCFPAPIPEQTAIAAFLDYKTTQIDRFIRKKKQLIKLLNEQKAAIINDAVTGKIAINVETRHALSLQTQQPKTKPSGIEWLGDIPKHWEIVKLTSVCDLVRGNSSFKKDELLSEGKYVALQYGKTYKVNEVDENFQFYVNDEFYKETQIVNIGEVILVSTSENMQDLGHSVFYNRLDLGLIGGEQILLKPNTDDINRKYLYYSSKIFSKSLRKYATGVKVYRFNVQDLKTIYTTFPPLPEQAAIVAHIEAETSIINKTIATIEKEITLVQEYRTALIAEAVTGKIDVRGYELPTLSEADEDSEADENDGEYLAEADEDSED